MNGHISSRHGNQNLLHHDATRQRRHRRREAARAIHNRRKLRAHRFIGTIGTVQIRVVQISGSCCWLLTASRDALNQFLGIDNGGLGLHSQL
jgi:hypothetical protein